MESGRILQEKHTQFAGFGQGQNAGAKFIYVPLGNIPPLPRRAFSADFYRMREFLPEFYDKRIIGRGFACPCSGNRLRQGLIERIVDFARIENLRVIFKFVEPLPFHVRVKHAVPPFRWRSGIGIARRADLDIFGWIERHYPIRLPCLDFSSRAGKVPASLRSTAPAPNALRYRRSSLVSMPAVP